MKYLLILHLPLKNPVNLEEGIFVRKANYENPLSPEKRDSILKKGQEKKKPRTKRVRFNPEAQELGNSAPWKDKIDKKWANLYMLATNLNLYPVPIEVSHDFTGYLADIEEPLEFQAPPLEKAKPKKKRRYVGWRKVRRRKPATRRLPKIENPVSVSKGKEIETGESSKQPEKEIGIDLKQKGIEIGESSKQPGEITFQEEIDRLLARCDVISPIRNNLYPYPATVQFPLTVAPTIPDPLIHTQPFGEMEEWWTND
ncbi:hypothetical protein Hanom_Chr01g00083541 [Helianthus anomalus]